MELTDSRLFAAEDEIGMMFSHCLKLSEKVKSTILSFIFYLKLKFFVND